MKNPVKLEKDTLVIDMDSIIDGMKPAHQKEFYQRLAFQEVLIQSICEHVATGSVEVDLNDFNDNWYFGDNFLEKFRRALLPLMPEVVQQLVTRLVYERDLAEDQKRKTWSHLWELQRAWPSPATQPPRNEFQPSFEVKKLTAEQVKERIEAFSREQGLTEMVALNQEMGLYDTPAPKPKVTIVVSEEGDWEAIYVDGDMKHEGHSLCARDVLDALGIVSERRQVVLDPYGGSLPQNLSDLKS